ncbi:MAG: glycosyltransferase family 4 protein [Pseudomonadota bacterium]
MGGGEHYILNLAYSLPKDQYQVISTCKQGHLFHEHLSLSDANPFFVDLSKKCNLRAVSELCRFIRSNDIHLLHAHGPTGAFYGRAVSILTRRPLLTTYHTSIMNITDIPFFLKVAYASFDRLCSEKDNGILVVSDALRRQMIRETLFSPRKIRVVYTGIDEKKYGRITKMGAREQLGLPRETKMIGFVGRLSEEKGLPVLLESFRLVTSKMDDTILLIAGDGPLKNRLSMLADQLGIQDQCIFLGYRNDIPKLLPALDLLALPSLTEGLPLILLEALASHVPVVASRVGGIPEILNNNINGILVPPKSPEALAGAIKSILEDSKTSLSLARAGRETIEKRFSLDRMGTEMGSIYHQIACRQNL